jgi:beta-galactosidase
MTNNRNGIVCFILCIMLMPLITKAKNNNFSILLNGEWKTGFSRNYTFASHVPGIAADPSKIIAEKLWYKKEILLPKGDWEYATLELKGARFLPEVFVNGISVSKQKGGMAPTFHLLKSDAVKPGNTIIIEIALTPLQDVPVTDASFIPPTDQWRSNVSSCLWDDVVLHLHGKVKIDRIIPFIDFSKKKALLKYNLSNLSLGTFKGTAKLEIVGDNESILVSEQQPINELTDSITIDYKNKLKSWSPEDPALYHLRLTVLDQNNNVSDQSIIPFGIKQFAIKGKQFYLNNEPCKVRGGTVVWHRWMRSEEGRELGLDTAWFKKNIVERLKEHGANYIRFHLGKPPERLLDLCDKYGLIVQYEWSFFHGMPATKESLMEQYRNWLNIAMRHPSVCMYHPYNETEGDQLKTVWESLDVLLKEYPLLVMEERDVIHVHKYWWSLFENVGLYYDDANQFPKTIMVDEFGGNYLDEQGNLGGYKSLKESYLRFLGRTHTATERLAFHAESNAKIAEYWRRIDAAGFAPFCMLSSWEDGNNWFLGNLKDGKPKPVWNELTAAYSPQSVSLDIWDRNFTPREKITVPVYFFNDTKLDSHLKALLSITDENNAIIFDTSIVVNVPAFAKKVQNVQFSLPVKTGNYVIKAELINKPPTVKYPVISKCDIHVFKAKKTDQLQAIKVAIPGDEKELKAFLEKQNIATTSLDDATAKVLLTSANTWNKIAKGDRQTIDLLQSGIDKGASVVMLDVGEKYLGQGYPAKNGDLGPLQGAPRINDPKITNYNLFKGVKLTFTEPAEPESHLHADKDNNELWKNIPKQYTWLWNGMRGGLLAPAADMDFSGLSANAFLAQWKSRGADENAIKNGTYYAYELQGFFEFSDKENDVIVQKKLKDKVAFLVEDAPALANSINPFTPVKITNLSKEYLSSQKGEAKQFIPLANCGKNLTRTPIALIDFGDTRGKLIVSQLLTAGRLAKGFGDEGEYGIRYDEVAAQIVLNMITKSIDKTK